MRAPPDRATDARRPSAATDADLAPGASRNPSRRHAALAVACAAAFALQATAFHPLRHDDAYITYRYAQNVLRGRGPVFNPGERVLGTTAPGHLLLAAAAGALFGEARLPAVLSVLGCAGWTLQGAAAFLLLAGPLGVLPAAALAALLLAGAAGSAEWVALETNLAAACVLFALLFGVRRRWWAAAAACGLGALLRPDALIAAGPLGVLCLRDLRRRAAGPALLGTAILAPWALFATLYYGSPLPQSLAAKQGAAQPLVYLRHLCVHPAERLAESALGLHAVALPVVALLWLLAGLGAVRLVRGEPRAWVLPAAALAHAAAYEVLRPPRPHTWHLYPWVWPFLLLVLCGVVMLLERLPPRRPFLAAQAALAIALVAGCGARTAAFARGLPEERWLGARDAIYQRVAAFLRARSAPGEVFSSIEVGTIAWFTDLPANDEMRLVTRDPDLRWRQLHEGDPAALRWAIAHSPQQHQQILARVPGATTTFFDGPQWRLAVLDLRGGAGER